MFFFKRVRCGSIVDISVISGNTVGCTAQALITGDMILGCGTAIFEDFTSYMASLKRVLEMSPNYGGGFTRLVTQLFSSESSAAQRKRSKNWPFDCKCFLAVALLETISILRK